VTYSGFDVRNGSGANATAQTGCFYSIQVQSLVAGDYTNTIAANNVTTAEGATNPSAASARVAVLSDLDTSKFFDPSVISQGGKTRLYIKFSNKSPAPITGLAVTDPLQIIATGLTTVETPKLIPFLKDYFKKEEVELIIMGEPKNWDESDTHATPLVKKAVEKLKKEFPTMPIKMVDERYTSKLASQAMIEMGLKKKQRQNKALVDEIAATIMLQEYLRSIS